MNKKMDESWRMRMGLDLQRRRSTEETSSDRMMRRSVFSSNLGSNTEALDHSDNFNDVFGGPPRTVLSRQFSGESLTNGTRSPNTFYEEIFRSSEFVAQAKSNSSGKKLPVFRIPNPKNNSCSSSSRSIAGGVFQKSDGFFDDIFGSDEDRRSRSQPKQSLHSKSKSKSNSSSVLSSEDLSPLRPSFSEDVFFTSYSSKLRPINIPGRRNSSSSSMQPKEEQRRGVTSSDVPWIHPPFTTDLQHQNQHQHQFIESEFKFNHEKYRSSSSHFGFSKTISSPETISIEPTSFRSIKLSQDDLDPDSPLSVVSVQQETDVKSNEFKDLLEEEEDDDDDDEIMSSYVIEINSDNKETTSGEAVGIDEAIAWTKEKFHNQLLEAFQAGIQKQSMKLGVNEPIAETKEMFTSQECLGERRDQHGKLQFLEAKEQPMKWRLHEEKKHEKGVRFF